jgi:ATP-dependent helicase Lhr and Lhr-like helicase
MQPPERGAFTPLHAKIQHLLDQLDFTEATVAQERALPAILSGRHTLLLAPTGYGKTEAALLPVLDRFFSALDEYEQRKRPVPSGVKILYITPLRALNRDMLKRVQEWARYLGITVGVRHSDTPAAERRAQALRPPDLLITTPETLQVQFFGKRLRYNLRTVRWVVVDEVHELATSERGYQLAVALERLEEVVKASADEPYNGFQRIGLSATVGSPQAVSRLLGGADRGVEIVEVHVEKRIELRVEHPHPIDDDKRVAAAVLATSHQAAILRRLKGLLQEARSTLVFSNTRDGTELLGSRFHLYAPDLPIGVHHGSLARDMRIEAEEAYKNGALRALFCTSSLELGIDVGTTDLVVQNSSPRSVERLLQRVGRSGHAAGRTSVGVVLAFSGEEAAKSAVVARRALHRELDPLEVRVAPLAVLANQLIHLAVEYGDVGVEFALDLLRRSAPFTGLTRDRLLAVLRQLQGQGSLGLDEAQGTFSRRATSRRYFLDHISMIPDQKTYRVIDASSRRTVGTLDEDFVASFVEPGNHFIMKGRTWGVLELQEEAVLVRESEQLGAIPSWVGEDLPVPWSVAREVGELRRMVEEDRREEARRRYPLDEDAWRAFMEEVQAQKAKNLAVPTDRRLTIETAPRIVVVNACWGTRTNEALGRLLSALVAQRTGEAVDARADAYRILLEGRGVLDPLVVEQVLREIDPEHVEALMRVVLRNATFLKYYLVHVARKFGALGKKLDPQHFSLRRLLDLYRTQPLFEEAIEKVIWERMDLPHLAEGLREIRTGRVEVVRQKLSPLGALGRAKEERLLSPERPEPALLETVKKRLEEYRVVLTCINCGRTRETRAGAVAARPECASCGSILLAPLGTHERDVVRLLKKKDRSPDEEHLVKRAVREGHLVATYGRRAVLALSGRGVGPDTAARILAHQRDHEADFLRDVLAAEVQYARTRSFWD